VEALEYSQAQGLAGLLLGFSFVVLLLLYSFNHGCGHCEPAAMSRLP